MENREILESLKQIRKHAAIKEAFSSYALGISDCLIAQPDLISEVCSAYGITSEELLFLITKEDVSNLTFLDEIMSYTSHLSLTHQESGKVYGKNLNSSQR